MRRIIPIGILRATRHPDYKQFVKGQMIFVLGFWLRGTALSWLIYSMTNSSFYLGLVAAISLLPAIVLGPLGGVITDKIAKKKILLATQMINIISTISMAILIISGLIQVWQILFFAFAFGTAQAIGVPARNAFIVDLVGRKDLSNAVPVNAAVFNLGALLGPALGGLLIPVIGEGGIFAMNIIGELYAYFSITKIQAKGLPDKPDEGQKNTLIDGFKYAYEKKIIFYPLALLGISSIVCAPINALLPLIATEIFHGDSTLFGMLGATIGIGAFCSALILASRTKREGLVEWIIVGTSILSFGIFTFAFIEKVHFAMPILFLIGIGIVWQNASINTLIQSKAPHQYAGRIMALHSMCLRGMGMVGSLFAGISGEYLGIQYTLILSAVILIVSGCYILPRMSKLSKEEHI